MVNVLILNYNDAETTIQLVNKIKAYKNILTICVVDNCSTDNSFCRLQQLENEKIVVIQSGKNGGYGYGNNFGIRYLYNLHNSDYVLLCNPDVIVEEETITKLESFLSSHYDYMIAAPFMLNRLGRKQTDTAFPVESCIRYILSTGLICSKLFHFEVYPGIENNLSDYITVDALAGSLFMFDVNLMLKHGMYDENIFLYCEERILAFKCKKAGLKCALLPNVTYIHNHSVSINKSIKSEAKKRQVMNASRLYVIKEYYKANSILQLFAKVFFHLTTLEIQILSFVRSLRSGAKSTNV